jgi:ureidoglycolate lyase
MSATETPPPITQRIALKVETLTPEAFAPFGVVLHPAGRERLPVNTYGDKLNLYREGFETDQPIEWFIVEGKRRPMSALFLERHMQITQAFVPMNGDGFVTIVAPPGCAEESNGLPAFSQTRAFHVPGHMAIQLYRGTWHENPFPLKDGQWFLVTSHAALTRGHQKNPQARLEALPLDLERRFYAKAGVELTVTGI